MRSIDQTTTWVRRRKRTIRFVFIIMVVTGVIIGAVAFLLGRASPTQFAADLTLNLVSEFVGALVVAWVLQGVLQTARAEMEDELQAIRDSDEALERRVLEAEAALREAEVRAEEAEERAESAERVIEKLQGVFSLPDMQKAFGAPMSVINSILSSFTPNDEE